MLRIATFNIRTSTGLDGQNSWWFRRKSCEAAIRELDADVVMLQEVRRGQLRFLRRKFSDHEFVAAGRGPRYLRGERLVIAVRTARAGKPHDSAVRWFSPKPERPGRWKGARVNRIVLSAFVDGQQYACLHLDEAPNPNLNRCIDAIIEWFGASTVIGGDFNCRIDDPALESLWRLGYRDALGHLPAEGVGCASHHRFSGSLDGSRIDHLLIPGNVPVVSAEIVRNDGPRLPSDHWPVVATVTAPTVAPE